MREPIEQLHGRRINVIHYPPGPAGLRSVTQESDAVQIHMSATYNGSHDEFWIIISQVLDDGTVVERDRINPRYVESWSWVGDDGFLPGADDDGSPPERTAITSGKAVAGRWYEHGTYGHILCCGTTGSDWVIAFAVRTKVGRTELRYLNDEQVTESPHQSW